MDIKELLMKVKQYNKLRAELSGTERFSLVLCSKYSPPFTFYKVSDLRHYIDECFIDSVGQKILTSKLVKTDNYIYEIPDTEFYIYLKIEELN